MGLLLLQFVLSGISRGHVQDTGLFRAWTAFAEDHQLREYYTTELYVDYPPVYLYVLFTLGKLLKFLNISPDTGLYLACIRSIPIFFDGLTAFFVYKIGQNRIGQTKALVLALLCAVNPAQMLNSTIWGQIDSVVTFFTAIMLIMLQKKQYAGSFTLLAILFLTKPQTVMFAPLLCFTFFFDCLHSFRDGEEKRKLLWQGILSVLAVLAVLLLVPLPITGGNHDLLLEKYKHALSLYPYATLNAPNLYGMLGGNWVADSEKLLFFSYKTWGFLFIVVLSLSVGYVSYHDRERKQIFNLGILTVTGIYVLGHGMHERYLAPALLLFLLAYLYSGDKKLLLFYGGFSLAMFIASAWVLKLNWVNAFISGDNLSFQLLSFCNVVLFLFWVLYTVRQQFKKEKLEKEERLKETVMEHNIFPVQKPAPQTRLVRLDYLLMVLLTVFYALFGFYRLGSDSVPETGFYAETPGESVVLDLGKVSKARQLYVYTGWIDRRSDDLEVLRDLYIDYSVDGETWEMVREPFVLDSVFMWHVCRDFPEDFRYVRLTCDDGRFYLNEAAFFGETESERFPIQAVESTNPTATNLIDEPEKVTYEFTWYETAYFDEIYHPRTAFEFITHRYPYENTHPPLGKAIIACGMLLFGVTPFGWRFFGTLCGVLMVPLVYVMGKKMLKKTSFAFLAAFVFSFDFMHLAQTRLATIDSYTAFFVMGMYLFMFLYIEKNFYETGVKKTLPPLLASGICFGLGAATKWQGIYAGFGLAFLFFFSLARRYAEYRRARKEPEMPTAEAVIKNFKPMAMKTICAGFGFFVLVPAVIYFLAYIPAMWSESTGLSFFFTNQSSMYNYHANLEAPHPYGSAWWQWPLDYKPLYAYSANRDFVPPGTSMGITSFGNPAIWWLTIPVVFWSLWQLWKNRKHLDLGLLTVVVGFFSLYVPWIFVTRTAFIYHFFPCVVFVVLMIGFYFKNEQEQEKVSPRWTWAYAVLVFALFLLFYPVLTGMAIPTGYAMWLRWIPGWVLG
ncbi:MAG: glycosyltransferase family 39 protein [Clostridia bacterium]|nr:glycosyltransferase family 39 protein [Clostridia bacterium]